MWMVTNWDGKHWCDEPQQFKTLGEAEACAKRVSDNSHKPHAIWNLVAQTEVTTAVTLKSF